MVCVPHVAIRSRQVRTRAVVGLQVISATTRLIAAAAATSRTLQVGPRLGSLWNSRYFFGAGVQPLARSLRGCEGARYPRRAKESA